MEFSVIVHLSFSRFPQFRYICGLNTDDMKFTQYLLLAAKGCAMGMADVVPGVSGGTIAFISGIYEELIESIKSVNGTALRLLGTLRLKEFWRHVNGRFLLPVLIGIGIAIFSRRGIDGGVGSHGRCVDYEAALLHGLARQVVVGVVALRGVA